MKKIINLLVLYAICLAPIATRAITATDTIKVESSSIFAPDIYQINQVFKKLVNAEKNLNEAIKNFNLMVRSFNREVDSFEVRVKRCSDVKTYNLLVDKMNKNTAISDSMTGIVNRAISESDFTIGLFNETSEGFCKFGEGYMKGMRASLVVLEKEDNASGYNKIVEEHNLFQKEYNLLIDKINAMGKSGISKDAFNAAKEKCNLSFKEFNKAVERANKAKHDYEIKLAKFEELKVQAK